MQNAEADPSNYVERREERASLDAFAPARDGYRRALPRIVDLSTNGVKLLTGGNFLTGKVIWLSLPTIAAKDARVVWDNGDTVGCEFSHPLHPAVVDHIVHANENVPYSGRAIARSGWAVRSVA